MDISREDFLRAASSIVTPAQADALWRALASKPGDGERPRFDLTHFAYYFGALIVMSALGWFMTNAWEAFNGGGIFLIATVYGLCFALAGRTLWRGGDFKVAGGLLFTLAVWMTPLAVYGLERWTGIWPDKDPGVYRSYYEWVRGGWFSMEAATLAVGAATLLFVRFPFLTFPIAFTLWFMSMDLTPLIYGDKFAWTQRLWVSVWFGLAMLVVSYVVDRRTREDYAFWGYLFGLVAFSGGLTFMESGSEWGRLGYALIHFVLMLLAMALDRRTFMVFGALGVFGYLGHLAYSVFSDSILFPFALTLFGIGVIWLGVQYQRRRDRLQETVRMALPAAIRRLLPQAREQR